MDKNNIFKNSYDEALFAYYILRRLDAGKVNTFDERLKSQKIQYFAQLFKVSPYYFFSLYIWGPYSPDLAYDLFQVRKEKIKVKLDNFIPQELEERFKRLEKFVKNKTNRQLELIATLHLLLKVARFSEKESKDRLVKWKKANFDEIKYTFDTIKNL